MHADEFCIGDCIVSGRQAQICRRFCERLLGRKMNEFHQIATFFALIFGSVCVVGASLYAAVRCFRTRRYFAGSAFLVLILFWFQANAILTIFMYAMATPNPATPTSLGEYILAPIYLAIAGSVCYAVLRFSRRLTSPEDEQLLSAEYAGSYREDDEGLRPTQGEDQSIPTGVAFDKKKIAGVAIIAIAVLAMRYGFVLESVLFVIVGVSLIMDVRIWRS